MKLTKSTKNTFVTCGMVVAAYLIMELLMNGGVLTSSHIKSLLVPICVYSMLAVSLNLTVGILGELSLGHAGFVCVGAFSGAMFTRCLSGVMPGWLCFLLAFVVGAIVAGVFGLLIGIPVLRLRGDYLAIVTLAFGEIIKNIVNVIYVGRDSSGFTIVFNSNAGVSLDSDGEWLMNGAQGVTGITKYSSFTIGVVLLLITLVVVLNFINSRTGRAVMAIRDNRIAAEATGINVTKYKLMAFTVSAVLAGMAGVLYAHNYVILKAKTFDYNFSILILVFVVLGGIGSVRGSVIAATILYILPEMLRGFSEYRMLIYAIVLIICMLFNWSPSAIEWREKVRAKLFKKPKGKAEIDSDNA
ncbi:MAG: branched-chain amino acid ABC transporter permease [Clostridia bacterium]|nr:branched-chain amino acid ABC transporter permease [Clostridia bacterium]